MLDRNGSIRFLPFNDFNLIPVRIRNEEAICSGDEDRLLDVDALLF